MDCARINARLEPFLESPLPQLTLTQISTYIDLLLRWNARINLTAIRDPEEIVTRHFGESIFLARHLFPRVRHGSVPRAVGVVLPGLPEVGRERVLDIGSGAGFPALPLKLWASGIDLALIESNHKKAAFLREAVRALTLTNINVIAARAEAVADRLGPAFPPGDVVTLRAVERFEAVLPLAAGFLAPNGRLALLISSQQADKVSSLLPRLVWSPAIPVPHSHSRVIAVGSWVPD